MKLFRLDNLWITLQAGFCSSCAPIHERRSTTYRHDFMLYDFDDKGHEGFAALQKVLYCGGIVVREGIKKSLWIDGVAGQAVGAQA
jgi:hypothetical protein